MKKEIVAGIEKNEIIEQKTASISYFTVFGKIDTHLKENKIINDLFGDEGFISDFFSFDHTIIEDGENLIIEGIDGIKFFFSQKILDKESGIIQLNFEVLNLDYNLTRRQNHYLKAIFYNLRNSGFNIKYIDDNFSGLSDKNYFLGNICRSGKICELISTTKDNHLEDKNIINELIIKLKDGEGDFEDIKNKIISLELKKMLTLEVELKNLILLRNEILEKDGLNSLKEETLDLIKNSGELFSDDIKKIEVVIENTQTDIILNGSFSILALLENNLKDLYYIFNSIENSDDEESRIKIIENLVNTSDDFFVDATKIAKKNGIMNLSTIVINGFRSILGKSSKIINDFEDDNKQKQINRAIEGITEFVSEERIGNSIKQKGDIELIDLIGAFDGDDIKIPVDQGYDYYEDRNKFHWSHILDYKRKNSTNNFYIQFGDDSLKELYNLFSGEELLLLKKYLYQHGLFSGHKNGAHHIYYYSVFEFSNYNDLENIFSKYEYFVKILFFKKYAFKYSEYTENYLKTLYKKGEFFLDENVDFDEYTKIFFIEIGDKFNEKEKYKKNIWERNEFEILENTSKKEIKGISEINNIFDIKIGENIFPVYIINPVGDTSKQIITIGTNLNNDQNILNDLLNFSKTINTEIVQRSIKGEIKDILAYNFDEGDSNVKNKKLYLENNILNKAISIIVSRKNNIVYEKGIIVNVINYGNGESVTSVLDISNIGIDSQTTFYQYYLNKYIVDYLIYGIDVRKNSSEIEKITIQKKQGEEVVNEFNHNLNKYLDFIEKYKYLLEIENDKSESTINKYDIPDSRVDKQKQNSELTKLNKRFNKIGLNFENELEKISPENFFKINTLLNSLNFDKINDYLKENRIGYKGTTSYKYKVENIFADNFKEKFLQLFNNLDFELSEKELNELINGKVFNELINGKVFNEIQILFNK